MPAVPLAPLELTPSGRPVLLPGEVETLLQDKVSGRKKKPGAPQCPSVGFRPTLTSSQTDVVFINASGGPSSLPPSPALVDGVLRVTTHRLLWVDVRAAPSTGASAALPLAAVARVELRATRLWSSPKVRVYVAVGGGGDSSSARPRLLPAEEARRAPQIEIKLVTPAQHAVLQALQASLASRVWERDGSDAMAAAVATQPPPPPIDDAAVAAVVALGFSAEAAVAALRATGGGDAQEAALWLLDHPPGAGGGGGGEAAAPTSAPPSTDPTPTLTAASAGVGGLLRREAEATAADANAIDAAFVDLRALMAAAADMVALARRAAAAAGGAPTGLEAELAALGIASPVTRESAGALYERELSAQLADFVAPRLAASGGLLPLTDVYCLFNRARGVELASPADVAAAARAWSTWRAPVRLREVEGGVLAVQAADLDDAAVRKRLAELAADEKDDPAAAVPGLGRPLTPSLVSARLRVPLAIASTLLLDAERAGALCRDDGAEGVRWWRNFFVEV